MLAAVLSVAHIWGWAIAVPIPVRLPAEVEDVYSLRTNPAGLGFLHGSELRLLYGRSQPNGTEAAPPPDAFNGGAIFGAARVLDLFTLGGAFELDVEPNRGHTSDRTTLGLGIGGTRTALGLAFEHLAPFDRSSQNSLSVGLTVRPGSWVSTAIDVRDIGQNLGPRLYDLGVAFRPFTDRVLLSARWRLAQNRDVFGKEQDLLGRIEIEPLDGIFIGGGVGVISTAQKTSVAGFAQLALALDRLGLGTSIQDTTVSTDLVVELIYQSRPRPTIFTQSRVAVLDLEGELQPGPSFNLFSQSFEVSSYGAVPLLLDALARSDHDYGVLLRIAPLSIGWAKAEEIRSLILALRATDRRVDCELTGASDLDYFIASACTTIMVPPGMTLDINGVAANVLFFADALEKVGVKVDYVAHGKYKSAPEQLARSGMSAPQREAMTAYLGTIYERLASAVAEGRKIDRGQVDQIIARGSVTATEAIAMKLIDKVLYPDEVDAHLNELYGHTVSVHSAQSVNKAVRPHWAPYPRIAIVNIDASITGGESRNLPFGLGQTSGAQTVVAALDAARQDSSIHAVVLRVDSPGGDSLASDLISHAVKRLNDAKPVIASFGDVAASGGYYVAANARAIYAEPTSLTGSIGVFSLKVSIAGLLAKLGINDDTVEFGALANAGSLFKEATPEEQEMMARQVDDAYQKFLAVVAKGRNKQPEEIRAVAEGRIWSGDAAKANGLVDEMGGLVDALRRAKKEAGLDPNQKIELVTLPPNREPLPDFVRVGLTAVFGEPPQVSHLGDLVPHALRRPLGALLSRGVHRPPEGPLALVPFGLDID
jgi:protease-4